MARKDSRDALRRTRRELRDTFAERAAEMLTTATRTAAALDAATPEDEAKRVKGLAAVDGQLAELTALMTRTRAFVDAMVHRMSGLATAVRTVLDEAAALYADTVELPGLLAARTQLDGPLRVAFAGRLKAGKSTLLNALVGEGLAATDATECTRVVTWYVSGPATRAWAFPSVRRRGAAAVRPVRRSDLDRPRPLRRR